MPDFRYPANVGDDIFQACIQFKEYERSDRNKSSPTNTYTLYMPERLVNPNAVSWDAEKLGVIAGVGSKMINEEAGILEGLDSLAQTALYRGGFNLVSSIAQKLGSGASSETLMGVTKQKIPNPYLTMLFRGVDFRTFEFSFKLYPHSQTDNKTISNIIKGLRKASLPPGSSANGGPSILGYPNEFEIQYLFNGNVNPWLNKFKRSVLVAVDTDYTGSGMWSMTRDGFPVEINLNLRFTEIEIVLRDDVQNGF